MFGEYHMRISMGPASMGLYIVGVCADESGCIITPRAHARARGYVIGRGVYIYINYILLSAKKISNFFLSLKILTFRRPLQHRNFLLRI